MRNLGLLLLLLTATVPARAQVDVSAPWRASYAREATGQYASAISALEALPNRERRGYLYLSRRAWLLYLAGDHTVSVAAYRRAMRAAPNAIEPRVALLLPLMALRRWQEAEPLARDVLARSPHHQLAERRLALVLYQMGRFEEAERYYRAVLERYPSDLEMQTGIGWCRLRQGESVSARSAFSRSLRYSPTDASARTGLTVVAHQTE